MHLKVDFQDRERFPAFNRSCGSKCRLSLLGCEIIRKELSIVWHVPEGTKGVVSRQKHLPQFPRPRFALGVPHACSFFRSAKGDNVG